MPEPRWEDILAASVRDAQVPALRDARSMPPAPLYSGEVSEPMLEPADLLPGGSLVDNMLSALGALGIKRRLIHKAAKLEPRVGHYAVYPRIPAPMESEYARELYDNLPAGYIELDPQLGSVDVRGVSLFPPWKGTPEGYSILKDAFSQLQEMHPDISRVKAFRVTGSRKKRGTMEMDVHLGRKKERN